MAGIFGLREVRTEQIVKTTVETTVGTRQYGYFAGGEDAPGGSYVCTIDRLDFFNETVATPGTYQLTEARKGLAAVYNSNYGYFAGGFTVGIYYCTIDRLDFSSETVSAPGNNLTQGRFSLAAVSNSQYGYFGGGFAPPDVCTIDRLDFSTETVQVPTAPAPNQLTQRRAGLAAVSSSNYGYFAGG